MDKTKTDTTPIEPEAKTEPSSPIEPIYASPKKTEQLLDCGHDAVYGHIRSGRLKAVKDGKRTKITMESIRLLAASLPPWKPGKQVGK